MTVEAIDVASYITYNSVLWTLFVLWVIRMVYCNMDGIRSRGSAKVMVVLGSGTVMVMVVVMHRGSYGRDATISE